MKNWLLSVTLLFLILFPLVNAMTEFYIEENTEYSILFTCKNSGEKCSVSANCNLSINYPNSSVLISNQEADNIGGGYYQINLTTSQTTPPGEYTSKMDCLDGSENGISTFTYEINPSGIRPSTEKTTSISRGIYFTMVLAILLFIAFLFSNQKIMVKWTYFSVSLLFFLITLNILFVGIQTEVVNPALETFFDGFTAIMWYLFWFVSGLLILMWIFTFIQTWFYKKNQKNLQRFGDGAL